MKSIDKDNILALASPSGIGAISMIRVSGPECISIVDNIFSGVEKIKLIHQNANTIQLGYIVDNDRTIDKVLVRALETQNHTPVKIWLKFLVMAVFLFRFNYSVV